MSLQNESKLNQLLQEQPNGAIYLTKWLKENGFSNQLLVRYKKSNWIESIGTGAFIRKGADVSWLKAVYALQRQAGLPIHPGGRTALSLQRRSHYLTMGREQVTLFGPLHSHLPTWFRTYRWEESIKLITSSFLPPHLGLIAIEDKSFEVKVSSPARALMECLYLAPDRFDLVECNHLMEGLNDLPPVEVQELLENCSSIKVKRLFLYMADKAKHSWLEYVDTARINIGKGKRHLVKDGVFIPKYGITVPKEIAHHE